MSGAARSISSERLDAVGGLDHGEPSRSRRSFSTRRSASSSSTSSTLRDCPPWRGARVLHRRTIRCERRRVGERVRRRFRVQRLHVVRFSGGGRMSAWHRRLTGLARRWRGRAPRTATRAPHSRRSRLPRSRRRRRSALSACFVRRARLRLRSTGAPSTRSSSSTLVRPCSTCVHAGLPEPAHARLARRLGDAVPRCRPTRYDARSRGSQISTSITASRPR